MPIYMLTLVLLVLSLAKATNNTVPFLLMLPVALQKMVLALPSTLLALYYFLTLLPLMNRFYLLQLIRTLRFRASNATP